MKLLNHIQVSILIIGVVFLVTSCFEDDEKIFPPPPGEETVFKFDKSIYDFHSYFDFSSDTVTALSPNDTWQIEFGTARRDWEIRINSSAYYQVFPTGDTVFETVTAVTDPLRYIFDASSGNPDSCAFSSWLRREENENIPTGEVFLVGQYDGIKVKPKWKIRFDNVTDTSYSFTYAIFPSGLPVNVNLRKDYSVGFLQFDLANQTIIKNEPPAFDYDLLFTQYGTILFDDNGVPTPYFVRGILLNPNNVEASLDTLNDFEEITYDLIKDYPFSRKRDVVGHEWKDVKVDPDANTAEYFVNTKLNWIIKDTEGFYYKMRFIEFYNSQAESGYTTIEYQRL